MPNSLASIGLMVWTQHTYTLNTQPHRGAASQPATQFRDYNSLYVRHAESEFGLYCIVIRRWHNIPSVFIIVTLTLIRCSVEMAPTLVSLVFILSFTTLLMLSGTTAAYKVDTSVKGYKAAGVRACRIYTIDTHICIFIISCELVSCLQIVCKH